MLGTMPRNRREDTRRKLIQAALETVAREGFEAASVDTIARRAGFSVGALYSNFRNKDDLFFAVFDEHVAWFEAQLESATAADDQIASFLESIEQIALRPDQFLVFVEFWAYAVRKPKTRRQLAGRLAEMRGRVAEVVGDERRALVTLATVRGLTLEKLADSEAVPDDVLRELATSAS